MNPLCDKVELFVDGELSAEEAKAFRHHLPECVQCQQAMDRLMQLDFLGSSHLQSAAEQQKPTAPRLFFPARWRLPAMVAAGALAAALAVLVLRPPGEPSLQSDMWLAERPQRLLEARVSYPAADRYRPPAARMMGGPESSEAPAYSYGDMAVLQERDPHGMAAALLVRDDKAMAKQARQALERLGSSPDVDSDRAVALLLEGKRDEALKLLNAVLAQNPRHPQALWNRALVLRELGLPLLAAQAFSEVAALKEPGWSEEAARKAEALQGAVSGRRERWQAVEKEGVALRDAPPAEPLEGFIELPSGRRHFYEAVRTAPSRERVLLLLPLAQKLDERVGGHVLEDCVRRVSQADFSRRAPLIQRYRELENLSPEEQKQLIEALLDSKQEDLLLGVLTAPGISDLKLLEEKAAASGDPWFQVLAMQRQAEAAVDAGEWERARTVSNEARQLCDGRGIEYRCIRLETQLAFLYSNHDELDLARGYAEGAWKKARELGEWQLESNALLILGEIARLSDGSGFLAHAFFGEYIARHQGEPELASRVHEALAVMAMQELRVEAARREIDAALATGAPLGVPGVFALADISRLKSAPEDEARLNNALKTIRLEQKGPGAQLIIAHVLGRFFIERDEEKGRAQLLRVIEQADAPEFKDDPAARRARAYSFTSLLLLAGRRNDFQEAMKLLERERGLPLPRRCLLVATVDSERTLIMARGSDGALLGHYDAMRRQRLPERLDGLVPEALVAALRSCDQVEVLARSPLNERPGLLPPQLAWSYLSRTSAERRAPPTGPAVHLVVSDVPPPPDSDLKVLNPWTPSFGPGEQAVTLSGDEATPSRVLRAMEGATEIDLVTHGVLDGRADSSHLLLAPEKDKGPKLRMTEVRLASLRGAPFVVLAACEAAHPTYSVGEPLSLPVAFIEAGARGVLAATVPIPDLQAQDFFNAVRERMRSGAAPAVALRDERVRWLSERKDATWVQDVLLFE